MPKYSIIVPVYNCLIDLPVCMQSVLTLNGDYELLLIDDGSTDGSEKLCEKYAEEDVRIRSFYKANGGAASARNLGIEESQGEYILFVDGDDTLEPGALEIIDGAVQRNPDNLILFGMAFDYYREDMLIRTETLSCKHDGLWTGADLANCFESFFSDNALSSACNKVFSGKILRDNNLRFREGMTLYEDFEFVLRYLMLVEQIICLPLPLYHYRNRIEQKHINARLEDAEKLKDDLNRLMQTMSGYGKAYPGSTISALAAGLYLQLVSQHLLLKQYSVSELAKILPEFIYEPDFQAMYEETKYLPEREKWLLEAVESGRFHDVRGEFRKRKWKNKIRSIGKRVLQALKLK